MSHHFIVITLLALLHVTCSRTALEVPPGPPTPDIECGQQANIPRTTFSLDFDSTFRTDPGLRRVTWNLRRRCLLRTEQAGPDSTPGNCSACFYPISETLTVIQDYGAAIALRPVDFSSYSIENPTRTSRSFSFQAVGAPSARWCVDGYVEFNTGAPPLHFGPFTRLLTASTHTDSGFMVTGGDTMPFTPVVRAEFIAEPNCNGREW